MKHVQKLNTEKDIRKKSLDIMYLEKQVFLFCLLLVWELLRLILWVFWFEIFTRHFLLCVLICGWDLSLKFVPRDLQWIFYSSLPRLKGNSVFVWNYLIIFKLNTRPFEVKFVAFSPKFCWDSFIRFQEEIFFGKSSRNFLHSKELLFPYLRNFALVFANLFWVHITPYSLGVLIWNFY